MNYYEARQLRERRRKAAAWAIRRVLAEVWAGIVVMPPDVAYGDAAAALEILEQKGRSL